MSFVCRDRYEWQLRTRTLALGRRTLIMGVLNVTRDSFSDGNLFFTPEAARSQALRLLDEGADMLDIGGESTRPGSHGPINIDEEKRRVLPVIEAVVKARPDATISIDTYKSPMAQTAIEAGAEIVNDVSGSTWDADMASVCAELGCGVVLMHTRGRSAEWRNLPALSADEVLPMVKHELAGRLQSAVDAGVERSRIVLDPGYGFGKSFDENYPILARQNELSSLGRPLLAGVSRKSFLGRTLADLYGGADAPLTERLNATLAASVAAILAGAHIIRVHDVRPAVEAACIADAVLDAV